MSHPNHELAVHGLVQRLQPSLVFLSDGGSAVRIDETRAGLRQMGHRAPVWYLGYREQELYDGLLHGDVQLFAEIASRVRAVIDTVEAVEVYCDAVEYYNPVHDITLPVTWHALGGSPDVPLFEVPLVYQSSGNGASYHLQRAPPSRRPQVVELRLTPEEQASKRRAYDEGYRALLAQIGRLCAVDPHLFVREEVVRSSCGLPERGPDVALRYDWRGRMLQARGGLREAVMFEDHWLPMAQRLVGDAAPVA